MFSGIVEEAATIVALEQDKGNLHLTLRCSFVNELKIDQSVAHNGVCLTVVRRTTPTPSPPYARHWSAPTSDTCTLATV